MQGDFNADYPSLMFDTPLKKPPSVLFSGAIASISTGTLVGVYGLYGVNKATIASSSAQYTFGLVGYLLSAVIPIVLFQLFVTRHAALSKMSKQEPYDIYAGIEMGNTFKKILALGLITAAFSVWVFLQPIAELFA